MEKRPTIKDVARAAGVTHSTVSRVIHDDRRISDKTKERVRKALKTLRYEPNLVARGLVNNRTDVVALITPELGPFCLPIVRSVAESATKGDYAMMLFPMNTWLSEDVSFEHVAQNWLVDGILIYNLIHHEELPAEVLALQAKSIPFVFINKFLSSPTINAVGIDHDQAVGLAIDHLAGLGRKRIGMLYGDLTSEDGSGRHRAFRASLQRRGLKFDESLTGCGYWYVERAKPAMAAILEKGRPDAMFCANDAMAIGAMEAIKARGLRVPEDIALVGVDDLEAAQHVDPPLTTIRPPLFEVGRLAFELLMKVIADPLRPPEQVRVKSELIVRASTEG